MLSRRGLPWACSSRYRSILSSFCCWEASAVSTLSETSLCRCSSRASQTVENPPYPSLCSMWYLPSFNLSARWIGWKPPPLYFSSSSTCSRRGSWYCIRIGAFAVLERRWLLEWRPIGPFTRRAGLKQGRLIHDRTSFFIWSCALMRVDYLLHMRDLSCL